MTRNLIKIFLLFSALFVVLYSGYHLSKAADDAIDACNETKQAAITKVKRLVGKMPVLHYSYTVDGKEYYRSQSVPDKRDLDRLKRANIILIQFECGNPGNSRLKK